MEEKDGRLKMDGAVGCIQHIRLHPAQRKRKMPHPITPAATVDSSQKADGVHAVYVRGRVFDVLHVSNLDSPAIYL